jgi:hypothetical protein
VPDARSCARALVIVGVLCAAHPASAQVQVQGLGGATNAAEHAPFFAGVLGIKISFLEIDLEGGRLQNVLPSGILDQIHRLEQEHGLPLQAIVRVPAPYAAGSVRFIVPAGVFQPFVSGGLGVARLQPKFDVAINGINLGDVLGGRIIEPQTSTIAIIGAGVRLDFHAVNIEGGYRYYAIFAHFERTLDLSRDQVVSSVQAIYGALAFRF